MSVRERITRMFKSTPAPAAGDKIKLELPPVSQAIKLLKGVFLPENRYETYDMLIHNDPELFGAIDTKATFVAETLGGFTVAAGAERSEKEQKLQQELDRFHRIVRKYYYDIAFKVLKDGNACYLMQFNSRGLVSLDYLPMHALTCVESEDQINTFNQVTKRGMYVLSEGTDKQGKYPASQVIHFDYGRKEKVKDIRGRVTIGIWNESPLESLRAKLLWKMAIVINDMIWRERNVPREHHMLPADQFKPDNFPGRTPKERYDNALKAAQEAIENYKKKVASAETETFLRPDQGYITLDNVKIDIVEPRLSHTDPNALLDQIDQSIYSVYVPESSVSGGGRGRGTFAREAAIMLYTTLKASRLAEAIATKLTELAVLHLTHISGADWTTEDFEKIIPRYNKILERHTLVRDVAILLESGAFTPSEIRRILGYEPLSDEDKEEIREHRELFETARRRHTESLREISTTAKRAEAPEKPVTPHSESEQQLT